jgi:hypothetical protein
MKLLHDDWNGYGSEAPNEFARANAQEFFQQLKESSFRLLLPLLYSVELVFVLFMKVATQTLNASTPAKS